MCGSLDVEPQLVYLPEDFDSHVECVEFSMDQLLNDDMVFAAEQEPNHDADWCTSTSGDVESLELLSIHGSHVRGARKPSRRGKVLTLMWIDAVMVFNFQMTPAWSTQCRNQLVSERQVFFFMTFLRVNAMDNMDTRNSKAQSLE